MNDDKFSSLADVQRTPNSETSGTLRDPRGTHGATTRLTASDVIPISRRRPSSCLTASVVINTYNRAPYLRNAIRSIAYQSYPAVELIVVNGPSTDGTEHVLDEIASEGLKLKIAKCASRNLSQSRNIGISEAAGDVVFFIDDDAVAHPDWISRLMASYEDPTVGAAGGFTIDHTGVTFQCRYTVCDRFGNASLLNLIDPTQILEGLRNFYFPSLLGTNCSFRRKDLLAISGFDEAYAYFLDETDVCLRLFTRECRIVTVPHALVFHKYAPSDHRSVERIPNSLFACAKSKAHFVMKHAEIGASGSTLVSHGELERYTREVQFSNRWYLDHKKISTEHYLRLDSDLHRGISDGIRSGLGTHGNSEGNVGRAADLDKGSPFLNLIGDRQAEEVKRRLKLYFVSQGYPPKDTSGIARWTHECAKSLTARGHEVHVLTRSSTDNHFVDYVDGVWIHGLVDAFPGNPLPPSPVEIPDALARRAAAVLAEIKRAEKIWGVSAVSAPIWDLEGILCVKYLHKPVVTSLHTTYLLALPSKPDWLSRPDYRRNHVDRVIQGERWLLENSAGILANSQEVVREIDSAYCVSLEADSERVRVIPHGIADWNYECTRKATDSAQVVSVLFVGRVEARKGVDQLLNALMRLRPSAFRVKVDIVGSWPSETDPYAQKVKGLAKDIAAKRKDVSVNFIGYTSDQVLLQYYDRADIFVAPSRFESFGLILVEAMRSGCPVIACDIGGMREIVDETTGFLVKVDDYESLASRLATLITDQALRKEMGRAGRRKYETAFTADRMAAHLETYFGGAARIEVPE